MNWKENKNRNWIIGAFFIIIDFTVLILILTLSNIKSYSDWSFYGLITIIVILPIIILALWGSKKLIKSLDLRYDWNILILGFFLFSVVLICYIINVFGVLGLVFWEYAYVLIPSCFISIIWCVRRIRGINTKRRKEYKKGIISFCLIIYLVFTGFALMPIISVHPLGNQFENKFKDKLGADYWDAIPSQYKENLKNSRRYYEPELRNFYNSEVVMERIKYGNDKYQIYDKYEDPTIINDNKPVLIFVHGGGSLEYEPGGSGKLICTYYASIGFVSFSIEYTPAMVDPFPRAVADVLKSLVHIKEHAADYGIDTNRIALYGQSRGGHLVTQVAYIGANNNDWWRAHGADYTDEQLEIACLVDMYGAVDQYYGAEHNQYMATRNEIIFNGTLEEKPTVYDQHTVRNLVSEDVPPTLIIHGNCDAIVNIGESLALVKELEENNADYIFLQYTFGQHAFDAAPLAAGSDLVYYFAPRFILANLYGEGFI